MDQITIIQINSMANEIGKILHKDYSLNKNIVKLIKSVDDRPGHAPKHIKLIILKN